MIIYQLRKSFSSDTSMWEVVDHFTTQAAAMQAGVGLVPGLNSWESSPDGMNQRLTVSKCDACIIEVRPLSVRE